jgi:hypothetical protein
LSEVSLSDLELSILAWPLPNRSEPEKAVKVIKPGGATDRFRQQIDLGLLRRATDFLRQEVDRQHHTVAFTRRHLPKGWYRKSNPTFNLEVFSNGIDCQKFIDLPQVCPGAPWQENN